MYEGTPPKGGSEFGSVGAGAEGLEGGWAKAGGRGVLLFSHQDL